MTRTEVLTWDWREQPDIHELARVVAEMSGGTVLLYPVDDTGSDEYALVVAGRPLTVGDAEAAYRDWLAGDDRRELGR